MPYSSISELPEAVRNRYSPRCQRVFMEAFNKANGDEAGRFKVGHTAATMCRDSGKAVKAEWDTAYINDLPDSAFACPEQRKYPHHKADGSLDLPHLRNALARVRQDHTETCGVEHLEAHARAQGVGKAAPLDAEELKAWFAGRIPRRLLAIPFGGPLGGRDLDAEWFSEKTDIKADWFNERPGLWHHGTDPTGKMGSTVIGKATNLTMDEDGWWVDFWLKAGEQRTSLIRRLVEKGADLFGSSGSIPHLVKRGKGGHIDVWPYVEQTLSTSPQNTFSAFRPAKAVLDDFDTADIAVQPVLRDVLAALDEMRDLSPTFGSGEGMAKADVDLSGTAERWNEILDRLRSAIQYRGQLP